MTHEPTTRLLLQVSWLNVRVIPTFQHTVLTVYHPNVQPNASEIKNQHFQCNTFNSSRFFMSASLQNQQPPSHPAALLRVIVRSD